MIAGAGRDARFVLLSFSKSLEGSYLPLNGQTGWASRLWPVLHLLLGGIERGCLVYNGLPCEDTSAILLYLLCVTF